MTAAYDRLVAARPRDWDVLIAIRSVYRRELRSDKPSSWLFEHRVRNDERVLVAETSYWLRSRGHRVSVETRTSLRGRVDLVMWDDTRPLVFVEFKTSRPMAGVAQLLSYSSGIAGKPLLVLAPLAGLYDRHLAAACREAGIKCLPVYKPEELAERLDELFIERKAVS